MFGRKAPNRLLAAKYGSNHVDREQPREFLGVLVVHARHASGDAGVVDQAGQRPESACRVVEEARDLLRVRNIGLEPLRPPAGRDDLRNGRRRGLRIGGIVHRDRVTVGRQPAANRRPDSPGAPGDDDQA